MGFVIRLFPYSLGGAIDWKLNSILKIFNFAWDPLLARGRDRLETL